MSEIEPIADIKIIKEDIFEKIKNIKSQSSIEGRDTFYLPILEDLYGALSSYEQYRSSSGDSEIVQLERKSVYSTALAWYRKMIEHLYYAILLDQENDEEYTKYIKYRKYDELKRKINEHKSIYGIEREENLEYVDCGNLHNELFSASDLGQLLYKKTYPDFKINSSFITFDKIHKNAWKNATDNEKLILGGRSYERLYGLTSYSIHSNITNPHRLNFSNSSELDGFFLKQFLSLIKIIIQRYTSVNIDLFQQCDYGNMFIGSYQKGDLISIYGKSYTIKNITRIVNEEDIGENILTLEKEGKTYKVPFTDK